MSTETLHESESAGGAVHRFQAETSRVLDIVIHSLYSHREIFLRELISNAADALDKLRFKALTKADLLGEETTYEIRIVPHRKEKQLVIEDTGVGMSKDELVKYLGTIAHSGTKRFSEMLKAEGTEGAPELIGQFGVGFYSAFIVADRVTVLSRAAGAKEVWSWSSDGKDSFTLKEELGGRPRGTSITLHLKEDATEFLDEWRLKELVRRYSDFIAFPIRLLVDEKKEDAFETVNKASALWRRPKKDISEADYTEFYKHLTHDYEAPLDTVHFVVEGTLSFAGLLFVPKAPPFDLFDRDGKRGARLYVKRIFIMEDCEQILPEYLRFVRGIVDSDDLPLNVSRELLQEDRIVRSIKKTVTSKVLSALERMASDRKDDYGVFWKAFGPVLKEGFHYDRDQKDSLAKLVRYDSTREMQTSLSAYVTRMPEEQKEIYYAVGQSRMAVEGSPHLEVLAKKGFEVLFLTDPIDEWVVQSLTEFDGKKLVSAMRAELDLGADTKKTEEAKTKFASLTEKIEEVLEDDVSEVKISTRLTESPACLVVPEGGLNAHMERMMRAHGRDVPEQKRILEINPEHPLIQRLASAHEKDPTSTDVSEWMHFLLNQSLLAEGSPLKDPKRYFGKLSELLKNALPD